MVSIIFILIFLVMEYIVADYFVSETLNELYHEFDPVLGWKPKPGIHEYKPPSSFRKHTININKLGLRNREISNLSEKKTKHVIVLGDSFTFGIAVSNEDLFTTHLENILNKNVTKKTTHRFEVINAGVPAYSTGQELLMIRYLAKNGIVGDIYLLMMFTNDISDNMRYLPYSKKLSLFAPGFKLDAEGRLILEHVPEKIVPAVNNNIGKNIREKNWGKKIINSILNLKIIDFIKGRIETLLTTKPKIVKFLITMGVPIEKPPLPTTIEGWYSEDLLNRGIPLLKALMYEIKKEAIDKNAKLLVVLIPSPIQVYDVYAPVLKKAFAGEKMIDAWLHDPARSQRIVRNLCYTLELPFLDLYIDLYQNSDENLFTSPDGHFNKAGHAVTAQSLANFIIKNVN